MAGADTGECDAQSLKRLLSDTALACQKCLTAVDSVVTSQQRQLAPSSVQSTTPSVNSVDIEAVEKLHRRCMQLEHQLAAERSSAEDQLSDAQQRHIDDIILKYKDRIRAIEDEKMEVAKSRHPKQDLDLCSRNKRPK